jgi:hypothetical protein
LHRIVIVASFGSSKVASRVETEHFLSQADEHWVRSGRRRYIAQTTRFWSTPVVQSRPCNVRNPRRTAHHPIRTSDYRFSQRPSLSHAEVVMESKDTRVNLLDLLPSVSGSTKGTVLMNNFKQMKLVYDYIKFYIGIYLATPPVFVIIAESFEAKELILFQLGLVGMIVIYALCENQRDVLVIDQRWVTDALDPDCISFHGRPPSRRHSSLSC